MDVQRGIKSSVLPMDSSFRDALKEIAASNDNTFSNTSNSVLCLNAKKRKKKKRKGMGREDVSAICVLYPYLLVFWVSCTRALSTQLSKQHAEIFDGEKKQSCIFSLRFIC